MDYYGDYDLGYDSWDYGGDMPGMEGSELLYGSDIEQPLPWAVEGGWEPTEFEVGPGETAMEAYQDYYSPELEDYTFDPESQVQYTPPAEVQSSPIGGLDAARRLFGGQFSLENLKAVAPLLGVIGQTFQGVQESRKAEKARREAEARRSAMQARRSSPLQRLALQRQATTPQIDLMTAGLRPGGLEFFSQPTYTPMADGGPIYSEEGGGQEDNVPIMAAGGEFVIPADVVSAIGDGNNEEGARKLDQMMQQIRQNYRSAEPDELPPQTGELGDYLG